MKGIRVEPCIPCEWKTAEITKRFREAVYRIQYENGGNEVKSIKVDGIPIESNILPYEAGGEYDVKVIMG